MATNKTNRSIHLSQDSTPTNATQPKPETVEIMPVRAHVYRTMAEMNLALEQAIQNLDTLVKINYFSSESLQDTLSQLSRTRAQANRELISILIERETANARYFQQLCHGPEAVAD
jgi:ABC-type uncharacterized transport system substrate-binding protein